MEVYMYVGVLGAERHADPNASWWLPPPLPGAHFVAPRNGVVPHHDPLTGMCTD